MTPEQITAKYRDVQREVFGRLGIEFDFYSGTSISPHHAELSQEWPVITEMKDPPEDSDDWREVKDKLQYLER